MTVYVDIVFIENVLINYIILLATSLISKNKIKYVSILLSSIIGGLYAILNYILPMNVLENIFFKIFLSFVMIKIAFIELKLKKLLICLVMFYLTSFTFGGTAFMLLFLISPEKLIYRNGVFTGTYPIKITLIGGIVGFLIIFIVSKIIKNRFNSSDLLCELEIFYNGKSKKIKTMLDTGNLLKEPISNQDVIIVEKESLYDIFNNELLENINSITKGKWLNDSNIHSYKIKIIPFSSLGNDNGLLIGFKPDYIKIYNEEEIVRDDVIIGVYNGKLTKNNLYTSLIGLNVLEISNSKN